MSTGKRIAEKMTEHGLTQAGLAVEMNVKQASVWGWLNDRSKPKEMSKLARILKTTESWLREEAETDEYDPDQDRFEKTAIRVTQSCMNVIKELETEGLLKGDASPIIEKVIKFFWKDFLANTPPDHNTIRRFIISML